MSSTVGPSTYAMLVDTEETVLSSAIRQRQWGNAAARMKHSPTEASTWMYKTEGSTLRWKVLPIHQACQREPPADFLQQLIEMYPFGVRSTTAAEQLPLHCACQWAASPAVIAALLKEYPESIDMLDGSNGQTPSELVESSPCYKSDSKEAKKVLELLAKGARFWKEATEEDIKKLVGDEEKKDREDEKAADVADVFKDEGWKKGGLTIVVIGASGDLAKKKTFPSLLNLYADGLLPQDFKIWGYARSDLGHDGLRERLRPFLMKSAGDVISEDQVDTFLSRCFYQSGKSYGDVDAFRALVKEIEEHEDQEDKKNQVDHNRLFYFAIPPNVFAETGSAVKETAMAKHGWTRVIVEKPFGRDLESYEELSQSLSGNFSEEHLYRIDHYLGKEMVQNLLILRFGNLWFERLWNRDNINAVFLTFKEPFGTEGRGGYFDKYGIIRDVLQNHLLQVFTLMAMEAPVKLVGPDSGQRIRDAKLQVLNATSPITIDNVVLGQYEGYADDETIENKDTNTATFAVICLYVNTPRWAGVPFILKAGKAMNEHKTEMRVQFKDSPASEFLFDKKCPRNELVMKMRPTDAIYMKTNVKSPGYKTQPVQSELEINYADRYSKDSDERDGDPDAYTRLLLDVLRGRQGTFVRDDELRRSWEIFTPVLHKIENENIRPIVYKTGSRGPVEADEFIAKKTDFEFNEDYAKGYLKAKKANL